ncbi:unnamed protein product [Gongylonema pulchrum]|uniref:Uncharacterized protein n=1 Tax=Gongylonema pulchrum TaxID=637853 RepID=A0A183E6R1_9BILA|nr:unnamed protein product [Gongylonema pulchrum]
MTIRNVSRRRLIMAEQVPDMKAFTASKGAAHRMLQAKIRIIPAHERILLVASQHNRSREIDNGETKCRVANTVWIVMANVDQNHKRLDDKSSIDDADLEEIDRCVYLEQEVNMQRILHPTIARRRTASWHKSHIIAVVLRVLDQKGRAHLFNTAVLKTVMHGCITDVRKLMSEYWP